MDRDQFRKQVAECAGLTTAEIAEALADYEQDEITRELLTMCAERVSLDILRTVPFKIRHTMYGDDDLSDWTIYYSHDSPPVIEPAVDGDESLDAHIRWERWEDLVRLINNDIQALSMFYSRRIVSTGQQPMYSNGNWWFTATNFPNLPDEERPGLTITYLRVCGNDEDRIAEYIKQVGLERIIDARAKVMSMMFADLGADAVLAGSQIRWHVEGCDTVVEAEFAEDTGAWTISQITPEVARSRPADSGVTLWFATSLAFCEAAGVGRSFQQLSTLGLGKTIGSEDAIQRFQAANRKLSGL